MDPIFFIGLGALVGALLVEKVWPSGSGRIKVPVRQHESRHR